MRSSTVQRRGSTRAGDVLSSSSSQPNCATTSWSKDMTTRHRDSQRHASRLTASTINYDVRPVHARSPATPVSARIGVCTRTTRQPVSTFRWTVRPVSQSAVAVLLHSASLLAASRVARHFSVLNVADSSPHSAVCKVTCEFTAQVCAISLVTLMRLDLDHDTLLGL